MNVDAKSYRCIDVDATLYKRNVLAKVCAQVLVNRLENKACSGKVRVGYLTGLT